MGAGFLSRDVYSRGFAPYYNRYIPLLAYPSRWSETRVSGRQLGGAPGRLSDLGRTVHGLGEGDRVERAAAASREWQSVFVGILVVRLKDSGPFLATGKPLTGE